MPIAPTGSGLPFAKPFTPLTQSMSQAFSPEFQLNELQTQSRRLNRRNAGQLPTDDNGIPIFDVHLTKSVAKLDAAQLPSPNTSNSPVASATQGFQSALGQQIQSINTQQVQAQHLMEDYAAGRDIALHQVMFGINRAELSLQLATQIRNRLVTAYQDIQRMPL
jgi:flagellar hook-basal body complex protein FliE